jgi:hypothetical protein
MKKFEIWQVVLMIASLPLFFVAAATWIHLTLSRLPEPTSCCLTAIFAHALPHERDDIEVLQRNSSYDPNKKGNWPSCTCLIETDFDASEAVCQFLRILQPS